MPLIRNLVITYIKTLFSDSHAAIISLIVIGIIAGGGSIYIFFENLWIVLINTILSPTPLWITIVLVLALYVLFYTKTHKTHSLRKSHSKIEYFDVGKYKWKVEIYGDNIFSVDKTPICLLHDLPLIKKTLYRICPEVNNNKCTNQIGDLQFFDIYQTAESYIDKQIRNKCRQS